MEYGRTDDLGPLFLFVDSYSVLRQWWQNPMYQIFSFIHVFWPLNLFYTVYNSTSMRIPRWTVSDSMNKIGPLVHSESTLFIMDSAQKLLLTNVLPVH